MRKNKKNKAARPSVLPKILVIILILLLLSVAASFAVVFVAARGPASDVSRMLCATMVEKGFPLTDVFFTTSEIRRAGTVGQGEFPDSVSSRDDYKRVSGECEIISGKNWKGYMFEFAPGSTLTLRRPGEEPAGASVTLGISSDCDAALLPGCLYYTVDILADTFQFFAMKPDGFCELKLMSAPEAVNSGYEWGISTVCVLVKNGSPATGLGGGYGTRAAIGQREDGSVLIFEAASTSIYPCGMTYGELAAVMFEYGATNAVALTPAGMLTYNGSVLINGKEAAGYSLAAVPAQSVSQ